MDETRACNKLMEPPAYAGIPITDGFLAASEQKRRDKNVSFAAFVAFDLIAIGYDQDIVDLGAVRYENDAEVASFSMLVNPGKALPPESLESTGIKAATLARAPGLSEAIQAFDAFLQGAVLLAHSDSYNMWLLRDAYEKVGDALIRPTMDALPRFRRVFKILHRHYPYPDFLIGDFIAQPREPYRAIESARLCGGEFIHAFKKLNEVEPLPSEPLTCGTAYHA